MQYNHYILIYYIFPCLRTLSNKILKDSILTNNKTYTSINYLEIRMVRFYVNLKIFKYKCLDLIRATFLSLISIKKYYGFVQSKSLYIVYNVTYHNFYTLKNFPEIKKY